MMFSSGAEKFIAENPIYKGTSLEATNPLYTTKDDAGAMGSVTQNPMFVSET